MPEMTDTQEINYRTLAEMFQTKTRDNGETFVYLKDDSPEWAQDFIREAHGTEMLPDDYRYAFVLEALEWLAEREDGDEFGDDPDLTDEAHSFADDVDVYTSELVAWLGSHAARPGYCDQAAEEGLVEGETDIVKRIMAGQYLERMEVFHSTIAAAKPYLTK